MQGSPAGRTAHLGNTTLRHARRVPRKPSCQRQPSRRWHKCTRQLSAAPRPVNPTTSLGGARVIAAAKAALATLSRASSTWRAHAFPRAAATRTGSAIPRASASNTAVSLRALRLTPRSRSLIARELRPAAPASSSWGQSGLDPQLPQQADEAQPWMLLHRSATPHLRLAAAASSGIRPAPNPRHARPTAAVMPRQTRLAPHARCCGFSLRWLSRWQRQRSRLSCGPARDRAGRPLRIPGH